MRRTLGRPLPVRCADNHKNPLCKGRGRQVAAFILPAMRYSPPHERESLHEYLGVQ
jgi:hypothetical protein